jgi:hypothetical protein
MTLFAGFTKTCQVARKSAPVTGRPSLHTALSLNLNEIVSGLVRTTFGFDSNRPRR